MLNAKDKMEYGKIWGKVKSAMSGKVDKVKGKCLSSNDYTSEDKEKVDNLKPISNSEIDNLFLEERSENL